MKKLLFIPLFLFISIFGLVITSQNIKAESEVVPSYCITDNNGLPICPQWQLAPNYCEGGTLITSGMNECGCSQPPSCEMPSPGSTACTKELQACPDGSTVGRVGINCEFAPCPSPKPTYSPAPSPISPPPDGCFYQDVQCIQAPCDPVLICPSPSPSPTYITRQYCQNDDQCSNSEFCYQPPMPYCPPGATCIQVMPARYCKTNETVTNNSISFSTPYAKISADNFYIEANGKKFLANDANIRVHSNPASETYTTLEITWSEHNVPMRMFIYFGYTPGEFWKVTELRTYDGTSKSTQLYYPEFTGNELGSELIKSVFDLTSTDGQGKIHFENLHLQAFLPIDHKPASQFGYYIEKKPVNDIEVFLISPLHGYGVNAILKNNLDEIVLDQSDFTYYWESLNSDLLTVTPQTTNNPINSPDGCFDGVSKPCPYSNAQMKFLDLGTAKVSVRVLNSTQQEVASEEFTFIIKQKSADLNNDGKVNILDYTILTSQFMNNEYSSADINGDGKVNLMDFTILMSEFNPNSSTN